MGNGSQGIQRLLTGAVALVLIHRRFGGGGVLTAIFDNLDEFKAAHRRLAVVNRGDAEANLTLPMHPGAKAFYEAGD